MGYITVFGGRKEVSDEMAELVKTYNEVYKELYEADGLGRYILGYELALDYGDQLIKEHHPLIAEFNMAREDILSSDREVAAFAIAASLLGRL